MDHDHSHNHGHNHGGNCDCPIHQKESHEKKEKKDKKEKRFQDLENKVENLIKTCNILEQKNTELGSLYKELKKKIKNIN